MIITRIFQGLGNQMFQYAYGFARSYELKTDLKIDTSYYEKHSEVEQWGYKYKRDFGLNRFRISAVEATKSEIEQLIYPKGKSLIVKITKNVHSKPSLVTQFQL